MRRREMDIRNDVEEWISRIPETQGVGGLSHRWADDGESLPNMLCVSARSGKNVRVWDTYADAEGGALECEIPLGMVKKDRYPWMVVMRREDFGELLSAWLREQKVLEHG